MAPSMCTESAGDLEATEERRFQCVPPWPGAGFMLFRASDLGKFCGRRIGRRSPFITALVHFPWLGFAALQAHISPRIGGASKTDFVPRVGVRIIGSHHVLHQQEPEAFHIHLLPDVVQPREDCRHAKFPERILAGVR